MKAKSVIGLRSATKEEIQLYTKLFPNGFHVTRDSKGKKLPYNGVFRTGESSQVTWDRVENARNNL